MRKGQKHTPESRIKISIARGGVGLTLTGAEKSARYAERHRDLILERARIWKRHHRREHPDLHRRVERKRRYGLTHDECLDLLEAQHHRCPICDAGISDETLQVDHDHETGVVRGLLCSDCNVGLGRFKDSPARLSGAVAYLEASRATS